MTRPATPPTIPPTSTGVGGAPPPPDIALGVEVGDWVGAGLPLLPFPAPPTTLDEEADIVRELEEDDNAVNDMEGARDEMDLEDGDILEMNEGEAETLPRSDGKAVNVLDVIELEREAVKLWRDFAAFDVDFALENEPKAEVLDVLDLADVETDIVEL